MFFVFNDTAHTQNNTYFHTHSLHDALPISAPCAKRGAEAALASRHLADSGHWSPFATALSSRCNKNIIPCADPSRRDAPPHGAHMNTSIFRTTALALSTLLFVAAGQQNGRAPWRESECQSG